MVASTIWPKKQLLADPDWAGRLCLRYVNYVQRRQKAMLLSEMTMPLSLDNLPAPEMMDVTIEPLPGPEALWDFVRICNRAYVGSSDYQKAGWVQAMALRTSGHFDPSLTWIARLDGRPVGFCMARLRGQRGTIAGLGVLPALRRQGVGTALMLRALETLAVRGAEVVNLYVPRPDTGPQTLYRKLGFEKVRPAGWGMLPQDAEERPARTRGLRPWVARICLAYVGRVDLRRANLWRSMTRPLEAGMPAPETGDIAIYPLEDVSRLRELIRLHNRAYIGASDYERVGWVQATALRHSNGFDPALIWMAYRDGALVGYCMARMRGNEAHITGLAVLPAMRRRGMGTMLMLAAMADLAARGATTARLEVPRPDLGSQTLYRCLGFTFMD